MLKDKGIEVDKDLFFYEGQKEKNCADVIGLIGTDNKKAILSKFNKDHWEHEKNAPFVEVKTFRKEQYAISVPMTQYEENTYYVLVESDFDDLYLLNFFNKIDKDFANMKMSADYILNNSDDKILDPPESIPTSNTIGSLRLLGVYKGSELKNHGTQCKGKTGTGDDAMQAESPLYIVGIVEKNKNEIQKHRIEDSKTIDSNRFIYSGKNTTDKYLSIVTQKDCIDLCYASFKIRTLFVGNV